MEGLPIKWNKGAIPHNLTHYIKSQEIIKWSKTTVYFRCSLVCAMKLGVHKSTTYEQRLRSQSHSQPPGQTHLHATISQSIESRESLDMYKHAMNTSTTADSAYQNCATLKSAHHRLTGLSNSAKYCTFCI